MIAIPAVDLRGGSCVQLVGGDYADERVRLDDPYSVARDWARQGFTRLAIAPFLAGLADVPSPRLLLLQGDPQQVRQRRA